MVGPLMLLKMLHCKRLIQRRLTKRHENEEGFQSTSFDDSRKEDFKRENNEYEDQNTCRVCLKVGEIPIYSNDSLDDISEALHTFGGIQISADDDYPKHLCQSCHALLQGAMLLRKTAQQSDQVLKQPRHNILSDDDDDGRNMDEDPEFECQYDKVKNTKSYHCKRCDLDFKSFKEYSEHRLSQEHENMRHKCPICKNTYTTLYYKKHLALHKLDMPYMCDVCGKKFIVQGQFARHRLTHFYNLPFKCSLCPYRGRFSESLKMHMRTHTGERPYQCTQCPSRFVNKSNLNKHMLTHRGEHDFKCESCGRGFYTKRDLDLHFKVDHTGIKDHICNICGKAFGYRKQMMKHQLKVHKREKLRSGRMPLYLQVENKQTHNE